MPHKCPIERQLYRQKYQREWNRKRRLKMLELLGGKCVKCGSTEQLEIDHLDPAKKKSTVTKLHSYLWNKIKEELSKCQLLCNSCHKYKTFWEPEF